MSFYWPNYQSPFEYKNVNHIHPLRQRVIGLLVQSAKNTAITNIVIFGSTVDGRCTEFSDVDVLVFDGSTDGLYLDDSVEWDVLHADYVSPGAELWKDILGEGVSVYDA